MIRRDRFSGRQFHRHALAGIIAVTVAFAIYTFWRQKEATDALTIGRELLVAHLAGGQLGPDWQVERVHTTKAWIGVVLTPGSSDNQQREPVTADQASTLAATVCPPHRDPLWAQLREDQDVILQFPSDGEVPTATVSCRLFLARSASPN